MKYTVVTGDTMYNIAMKYGIALDELIQANPEITNPDLIYPGQVIEVPVHAEPPVVPPGVPPVVEPGVPGCPPAMPDYGMLPGMPAMPDHGMLPGMPAMPDYGMVPGMPAMPDYGMLPGMPAMPDYGMLPGAPAMPDYGMVPGMPSCGPAPGMPFGMLPAVPGPCMMPGLPMAQSSMKPAKLGDRGEHIKYLQKCLKELGYYNGSVTGRFGSKTKCAVRNFQHDCSVPETGVVDAAFWATLGLY